jgi:hypothetical protein
MGRVTMVAKGKVTQTMCCNMIPGDWISPASFAMDDGMLQSCVLEFIRQSDM